MNPAFQPTAVLGSADPGAGADVVSPRLLQAAAAALALMALPLSALLRWSAGAQRRQAAAQGWVDPATGLYNLSGLAVAGDRLLSRTRRDGQPLTLAVLDFSDLLEVRGIYGREVHRKVLARVVRKLLALAGPRGMAVRTDKAQFCVLLPRASRDKARAAIQRVLGKPSRIEFDAGDSEIVLVPDILAETAAPGVETLEELLREVTRNLAEMRAQELRRQHWLQRERERHSRPMSLPAALDSRPPASR